MATPWYKSKKGWITSLIALIVTLLNRWGQIDAAREIYVFLKAHLPRWSTISPWTGPGIFVLAIIFFEADRRKRQRARPYDLQTSRGRTLQLRDDMQKFLEGAPPHDNISAEATVEEILAKSSSALRVARLHHGYELNFAAPVRQTFHEFGERNLDDPVLAAVLDPNRQVNNEAVYNKIIERLSLLADRPEANS